MISRHLLAATPITGNAGGAWASGLEWINLWPSDASGLPSNRPTEQVNLRAGTTTLEITGVNRPRLMVLRPARPNGAAALVMPGGGYARLVVANNGPEIARWLVARGWTVFVLLYRLPGDGWVNRADVPLQDAQRAMRLVRALSGSLSFSPDRIAAIGFSAGGHLCSDLATRSGVPTYTKIDVADDLSARPDFAAPIYAVQTMADPHAHRGSRDRLLGLTPTPAMTAAHSPENNVTRDAPPFLLIHAEDDPTVSVENSLRLRASLKGAGVPVETHLFPKGGHGFGISGVANTTTSIWPELIVRAASTFGLG